METCPCKLLGPLRTESVPILYSPPALVGIDKYNIPSRNIRRQDDHDFGGDRRLDTLLHILGDGRKKYIRANGSNMVV